MKKEASRSREAESSRGRREARRKGRVAKEATDAGADEVTGVDGDAAAATEDDEAAAEPAETAAKDAESEAEARIAALEADLAEASDRALRTLAEFDNYRRRSAREREDAATRGMADILRELLDVADNFDRALEHAGNDVPDSFLEGMRLVARGLHDLLDRKGVSRMDADGRLFDPEHHDALTRQPTEDAAPNTVVQVIQPGYAMKDRVLRPAKVIVARATDGNAR